ncbi:very short patch repair endonuclease [Actinoplanes sp. NPDC051861]|uniref:very short patch repair endonuclease n=1 Tax=Actinoplanes sp. NPDC051861 TaxID=3155170 RepID=UPI0034486F11
MVDKLVPSSSGVSARMSRQKRQNTVPELAIRRLLHAAGLRYRVAWRIPGMARRSVDIAFTRAKLAIFVDGCFWHSCPQHRTSPASNSAWWANKLETNQRRDTTTDEHLAALGWNVLRIWEHDDPANAARRIIERLQEANEPCAPGAPATPATPEDLV